MPLTSGAYHALGLSFHELQQFVVFGIQGVTRVQPLAYESG